MKRVPSLVVCAGLALGLSAATSVALPPVVERVPDTAVLAVVFPSPDQAHQHLNDLLTAVEAPMQGLPDPKSALQMAGFPADALDTSKSAAVVFFGPADMDKADLKAMDWAGAEKRMVLILPVTGFDKLVKAFDPEAKDFTGVREITMPDGDAGFTKDIGGGFAVLGPDRTFVEAFGAKGADASFKTRMGKGGEALADASDLVTIVNMDRLRNVAQQGLREAQEQAKAELANVPGAGDLQKNFELVQWLGETVVRDTQVLVGGVKLGASGVNLDMVGAFKPESYLAKAFSGTPNAGALMSRLPAGPFYLAGALDFSSPGAKAVWRDFMSRTQIPGGEQAKAAALANVDNTDGQAAVVGFPNGGVMSGLLTATVAFTAARNPDAAVKGFRDALMAADGQTAPGVKMTAKYTEGGGKAGDNPVDAWEVRVTPAGDEQNGAMQMQQIMAFMFGPAGAPSGYVAKTEGGFYTTYAKNSELLGKALNAQKGENLAGDAMLKQVQGMLPSSRLAEGYIGTKSILDTITPFMAMGGIAVPVEKIPEKLPPVGAAISSQEGSARFSIMVPAAVIKTGISLGEAAQQTRDQGEAPVGDAPKKRGTGQPKF
jgi:hypothetical protein